MADSPLQKATLGSKMHVGIFVMDRTCAQANETDHACPLDLL
jgi:hypothetical protein